MLKNCYHPRSRHKLQYHTLSRYSLMAAPQLAQHEQMYIDLIGAHLLHFTVITEVKLA